MFAHTDPMFICLARGSIAINCNIIVNNNYLD